MVVGDRQRATPTSTSRASKRRLQRLGSWVVRQASSTEVPDTTSGFRAYNREAALQMQVVSKFTYTLETIIQAGKLLVAVDHVPIRTNPKTRESRLFPSIAGLHPPQRAVDLPDLLPVRAAAGVLGRRAGHGRGSRWRVRCASSIYFIRGDGAAGPHPVADLGAVLFNAAMLLGALGVIGDLLAAQRTHARSGPSSGCAGSSSSSASSRRTTSRVRRAAPGAPEPGRRVAAWLTGSRGGRRYDARDAPRSRPATPTTSTARPTRSCAG